MSAAINSWSHLALTWDGTSIKMYVNGVVAYTLPHAPLGTGSDALGIGGDWLNGTGLNRLIGTIDEFAIYPTALTSRLLAHYNAR